MTLNMTARSILKLLSHAPLKIHFQIMACVTPCCLHCTGDSALIAVQAVVASELAERDAVQALLYICSKYCAGL